MNAQYKNGDVVAYCPDCGATTWSATGIIGTVGSQKLGSVRDDVRDLTDQFINAYLAANPKR